MALRMCVSVDMTIVWIGMRKRIRIRNDIYTCERKKESDAAACVCVCACVCMSVCVCAYRNWVRVNLAQYI